MQKPSNGADRAVNITLCAHFAAACVCIACYLIDHRLLQYSNTSIGEDFFRALVWGAISALAVCPITVLAIVLYRGISRRMKFALLAELLLFALQVVVLAVWVLSLFGH